MSNLALNDFNPNTHRIDKSNKTIEIDNILIFFGYRNAKFFAWLAPATPHHHEQFTYCAPIYLILK